MWARGAFNKFRAEMLVDEGGDDDDDVADDGGGFRTSTGCDRGDDDY